MAGEQKILRATDKQIVNAFKAVCAELKVDQANFSLSPLAEGRPVQFTVDLGQIDNDENLKLLLDRNSVLFRTLTASFPTLVGLSIKVERGEPFDTIHINIQQQDQPAPGLQVAALAAIDRHFQSYKPTPIPDALLGKELADFYRSRPTAGAVERGHY